jgi:hypothetical protein
MSGASLALPDDVVVGVVVDGNVVVHGVARVGSDSSKDSAVEYAHQGFSLWWDWDATFEQNSSSDAAVVHFLVGISSFNHGTALEGDTSEQSFCLAVCENAGDALETCCTGGFGIATNGTGGDGDVSSEGDTASLGECTDGGGVVEDEDEISDFKANLTTKATSYSTDGGGSGPGSSLSVRVSDGEQGEIPAAVGQSSHNNTRPEASTAEEAGLEDGHDGQTFGICEDVWRNDLVRAKGLGRVYEGRQDLGRLFAFAWLHRVRKGGCWSYNW